MNNWQKLLGDLEYQNLLNNPIFKKGAYDYINKWDDIDFWEWQVKMLRSQRHGCKRLLVTKGKDNHYHIRLWIIRHSKPFEAFIHTRLADYYGNNANAYAPAPTK